MKKLLLSILLLIVAVAHSCQNDTEPKVKEENKIALKDRLDTVSYAMGINIGNELKKYGVKQVNYKALNKAIEQVLAGTSEEQLAISSQMSNLILKAYLYYELKEKDNGQKPDKATPLVEDNSIYYTVIEKGSGPKVNPDNYVTLKYTGYRENNTPFDTRFSRKPIKIKVNAAPKGWQIVLPQMRKGDKWLIHFPIKLIFGDKIPKNLSNEKTVVYEIKILEVKR